MEVDLHSQHEELQRAFEALQSQNQALQSKLLAQESYSRAWLERRNRELMRETREQAKSHKLQRVFYRIAERAAAGLSLYDFLHTVHTLLGELLYARNCSVCLLNATRKTLDYPYHVDERDGDTLQSNDVPMRRGLSEFVLRTGTPQLITARRMQELIAAGEIAEAAGDLGFSAWLGVPISLNGAVGGVLAVKNYAPDGIYTADDVSILQFVAHHFSSAMERYQTLEALRTSESRYRALIENIGVGVVVVQDERMVFINPALEHILGYSAEALMSQVYTATVHPDDVAHVVERHARSKAGHASEKGENFFGFRVVTRYDVTRHLEASAVTMPWSQRDATLLLLVDVTARMESALTQQMALQRQMELTEMKTRFINMASHEFRTPLSSIHGSVELLRHYEQHMSAEKRLSMLEKIEEAVQRMTHMLENVLVFGRTDAGKLQFQPRPVALAPLCRLVVEELCRAMGEQATATDMQLQLPADTDTWLLDETLMRNILGNLLSNAVKYSPHRGQVRLHVQETPQGLAIEVQDQGIGIPEADQARLFENYFRASNVGPIAGTGLGLSIVREAVQCHGGNITVQSQPGQGTCFSVVLPATKTH